VRYSRVLSTAKYPIIVTRVVEATADNT